ncbi:MAG: sulfatase-like hydrolase/transferase [Rubritalea sp.]|uniref:sulfatase-like hydrolase/transferase n=1 Tax=Rubritalea sp. TaxID=2109375 RepID=UPI00324240FF
MPFLRQHEFGSNKISPYLGENYLGSHILISLGLAACGTAFWGSLSRWLNMGEFKGHKAQTWMITTLCGLALILTLGTVDILTGYAYLAAGAALVFIIITCAIKFSHHPTPKRAELKILASWLTRKHPWNGPFFFALYALLLWHNYELISGMLELSPAHKISLFINRMFTQLSLIGVLYFATRLSIDTGPRWIRPWVWIIASMAPIAIVLDRLLHGYWNQTFLGFLNKLGTKGLMNFGTELQGGGIHLSVSAFASIGLAVALIFCLLTYGTSRLARKWKLHTAPVWMLVSIVIGFTGASVEQAIGKSWKPRRNWMQEYKEFGILLSPVRPPDGLAHFQVVFRDHHWQEENPTLELKQKPDIYLVFIESFRHDALRNDVTPFLHDFATTEAQPIGHTWAASNGTHLSWFSTFTSQIATAREQSRDIARELNWPGLPCFHILQKSGYDLQVHTGKNLAFRDMRRHFHGLNGSPFSTIRENVEGDPSFDLSYPEREVIVFNGLKQLISTREAGGHLTIATIDSPHYKYSWHDDFEPPFKDYYPHAFFPSSPSLKETELIKNQYFNSLAWADSLAKDFCEHLKKEGKYDDSIIIFAGDHGEEFQEHGGWLHVSSLEDEQIKVPMLIKWPKSVGRGPEVAEASHLDLMPSLLHHMLDDAHPLDTAGESLLATPKHRTSIATTAQGGITKEAMLLTREGYKAYFSWPHYFDGRPGTDLTLTRLIGLEGDIELGSHEEYDAAIKEYFPDAFERFFESFELKIK